MKTEVAKKFLPELRLAHLFSLNGHPPKIWMVDHEGRPIFHKPEIKEAPKSPLVEV